ncbi:MAG: lipid-A-disaccharide synthase, partial [Asticcacaulis sp.]
ARTVDLLLALHPFDPPWFEKEGLKTVFVGNPALEVDLSAADPDRFRQAMGWDADQASVMILPGSRPSEIARMMPVFELAARRIKQARPDVQFLMPLAETVSGQVEGLVATWPMRVHLVRGERDKHDAMKAATVALACSGTVSTELAIAECPMVVGYRVGTMTYWLLKLILTLPFITMFNIAAGRAVAPEFVQSGCTPEALAEAVLERLNNPALRATQIREQTEALIKMGRGGPDPSELAARAVMDFMKVRHV